MQLSGAHYIPLNQMMQALERHNIDDLSFEQQIALLAEQNEIRALGEQVIGKDVRVSYALDPATPLFRVGSVGRAEGLRFRRRDHVYLAVNMSEHLNFKINAAINLNTDELTLQTGQIEIHPGYGSDTHLAVGVKLKSKEAELLRVIPQHSRIRYPVTSL